MAMILSSMRRLLLEEVSEKLPSCFMTVVLSATCGGVWAGMCRFELNSFSNFRWNKIDIDLMDENSLLQPIAISKILGNGFMMQ